MKELQSYLEKIKKTVSDKEDILLFAQRYLTETTGVNLPLRALSLKNNTLFVSASPAKKNQIFMNKKKAMDLFKEGKLPIVDLR